MLQHWNKTHEMGLTYAPPQTTAIAIHTRLKSNTARMPAQLGRWGARASHRWQLKEKNLLLYKM